MNKDKEYRDLDDFEKFQWDAAEEFLRAGLDMSEIYNLMDREGFEEDMRIYMEENPDSNGMEYAQMLLNKWSGVPKYDDRGLVSESLEEHMNEGILSKRRPKRITDGVPMNKLVDVLDKIEDELGISREEAVYLFEKNIKYIKDLIKRRFNTYEIFSKLIEDNLL